jgi:DNA-directed RNA polymerase specialized sigma24 family protein
MPNKKTKSDKKIIAIIAVMEQYVEMSVWIAAAKAANAQAVDCAPPFNVDAKMIKAKSTRDFVLGLPDCREKLFLYYHYISGMSMERTAELLGISPRTAYRLRLRALDYAARRYYKPHAIIAG